MKKLQAPFRMPDIYVCEDVTETRLARIHGIPYIVRPKGVSDETLIFIILKNSLSKMFPNIDWKQFAKGKYTGFDTRIRVVSKQQNESIVKKTTETHDGIEDGKADIASGERISGNGWLSSGVQYTNLDRWLGDKNSSVNLDVLMDLEMMPAFCLDITKAIRKNLIGYDWADGYNKKLDMCSGTYSVGYELKNLLIIDVSHSIPRGISSTMLTLAETLKDRLNADLIVTGASSMMWRAEDDLPSPQWIRNHIGLSNETFMFTEILMRLAGEEYANVIGFGDWDTPSALYISDQFKAKNLPRIKVHNIYSFHTAGHKPGDEPNDNDNMGSLNLIGYLKWTKLEEVCELDEDHNIWKDTEWCNLII